MFSWQYLTVLMPAYLWLNMHSSSLVMCRLTQDHDCIVRDKVKSKLQFIAKYNYNDFVLLSPQRVAIDGAIICRGFEPGLSRSRVRHSTAEPRRLQPALVEFCFTWTLAGGGLLSLFYTQLADSGCTLLTLLDVFSHTFGQYLLLALSSCTLWRCYLRRWDQSQHWWHQYSYVGNYNSIDSSVCIYRQTTMIVPTNSEEDSGLWVFHGKHGFIAYPFYGPIFNREAIRHGTRKRVYHCPTLRPPEPSCHQCDRSRCSFGGSNVLEMKHVSL